jgi:hypothetical protein
MKKLKDFSKSGNDFFIEYMEAFKESPEAKPWRMAGHGQPPSSFRLQRAGKRPWHLREPLSSRIGGEVGLYMQPLRYF